MHLRRTFAIAAGAAVLSIPLLSSCGFDLATDQVYTPAAGTNERSQTVDVLNAVVVAAQPGSGTLVAGLSNAADEPVTLTEVTGAGVELEDFSPIEIEPEDGFVNLADEDVHLTGEIDAGGYVPMTLEFDNGETVEIDVPVVTNCDEFEGYDTSSGGEEQTAETYSCEIEHLEEGH